MNEGRLVQLPVDKTENPVARVGAIARISALAIALLLGFGMGVTFELSRENRPPERSKTSEESRIPAAPTPTMLKANESGPSIGEANPPKLVEPPPPAAIGSTALALAQQPAPAKAGESAPPTAEAKAPPPAEPSSASNAPQTATPPQPGPSQPPMPSYAYVYRFQKNGTFEFKTGSGKFENLPAVRTTAITECRSKGGQNCKFNFAPAGGCIAIAQPPFGEYRVSKVHPDEASASADALDQCLNEHDGGCRVAKVLCPQS